MKAIRIEGALLRKIRSKSSQERREIGEAIAEAQRCIGQPHLHKGIGLRKLQDDWFEIRIRLKQRLVFENTPSELVFEKMGNHDEVKRFLKSL